MLKLALATALTIPAVIAAAQAGSTPRTIGRIQFTAVDVDRTHFAQMRAFTIQAFGMKLIVDKPDLAAFATAEGSIYEIYGPNAPDAAWRHGQGGMVIGFLTDDIRETLKTIQAAGGVLIGDLNVAPHFGVDGGDYGYQLYRAADHRVYAIAQNKNFHR